MSTDEIVGTLIFMPGRREVVGVKSAREVVLDGGVGDVFGSQYAALRKLASLLTNSASGECVFVKHTPTKRSLTRVYLLVRRDGCWHCSERARLQTLLDMISKRFRAETMSPSDFG